METTIICTIITGLASVTGSYLAILKTNKESEIKNAVREQKQQDQIETVKTELKEVKDRLDKHNHYAEKFNDINVSIKSVQKDIEYIKGNYVCTIKKV